MTRKTDHKGRVTLFDDFANQTVVIERISATELRIRKARVVPRRKYRFADLMAQVTDENFPEIANSGPPVGREAL